jgi:hypothetical protein
VKPAHLTIVVAPLAATHERRVSDIEQVCSVAG